MDRPCCGRHSALFPALIPALPRDIAKNGYAILSYLHVYLVQYLNNEVDNMYSVMHLW